jgi:Immunoglobulin domain
MHRSVCRRGDSSHLCRVLFGCILPAFVFFLCLTHVAAAETPPLVQWQKSYGGNDDEWLQAMQKTSDGGFIVGGSSRSGVSGNKTTPNFGDYDFWVLKLDGNGNKLWERDFGGTNDDELTAIQPTSDGGYVLGGYSTSGISGNKTATNYGGADYWLIKLDSSGNVAWQKSYGGTGDDRLYSVQQTSDNGFLLCGSSDSPPSGTKTAAAFGGDDFWVIKVDATGNKLWEKSYGGSGGEVLRSAAQTADGGYILGGDSTSGVSGNKTSPSFGEWDFWVIKADANGEIVWQKPFGGLDAEYLWKVLPTAGGFMVAGSSQSYTSGNKSSNICYAPNSGFAPDYWVLKLDDNGNKVWENVFGGTEGDSLFDLQEAPDGYVVTGLSASGASCTKTSPRLGDYGYLDAWVLKLDRNGNKVWEAAFGAKDSDYLQVVQRTQNGYILGGASRSSPSGNKTAPAFGGFDFWLVKLEGPPVITQQPQSQTITVGDPATFSVSANGEPPLSYQWFFNGSKITGATSPTLSLFNTSYAQAGLYSAVVSNNYGAVTSSTARLEFNFLSIKLYAGLRIDGRPGETYRIEFTPNAATPAAWQMLSTVTLTNSSFLFFDINSPQFPTRFYRAVLLP